MNSSRGVIFPGSHRASAANNWRRPPRAYSAVRRRVQVRTFKGWSDYHEPGWLEIDLNPQRYGKHHLRTLQRRLRGYRLQLIEREMAAAATAPIPGMQGSKTGEMPVLSGDNQSG